MSKTESVAASPVGRRMTLTQAANDKLEALCRQTGMEPGEWVEIALNSLGPEALETINAHIKQRAEEQMEHVMAMFSTGGKG